MSFQDELRKILFKAAGGISDMANEEITSIINLVEKEVIGEDETENMFNKDNPLWLYRENYQNIVNELRAEQRAIIRGNDD